LLLLMGLVELNIVVDGCVISLMQLGIFAGTILQHASNWFLRATVAVHQHGAPSGNQAVLRCDA
jgi:hypothetical protein